MSVNQLMFLILVFLSLFVYYLTPRKYRWFVLLAISLYFYHLMGVSNFLYLILATAALYAGTLGMAEMDRRLLAELAELGKDVSREEKKARKAASKKKKYHILLGIILVDLGLLLVLKYGTFFLENISALLNIFGVSFPNRLGLAAPLGISYYTLQAIGYALEVYKGKTEPERNPLKVLLYVTYYPQMTQGPIGRWRELAGQLFEGHSFAFENLAQGCRLILWGLFKKSVVGDNLKPLVNDIFSGYQSVSGFTLLLGCFYMTVQLYADFSGYTDLVRGISKLYGIDLGENFQRPFFAQSLGEYWRRWHISLSSWFRDYVFYPASISKGAVRFTHFGQKHFSKRLARLCPVIYAMAIVWFCTGFWHDASWRYIFWGIGNGAVLIGSVLLEPQFDWLKKKLHIPENAWWWKLFGMVRTFLIVALLKVFPGADDTAQSVAILNRMLFHFSPKPDWASCFLDTGWYTLAYAAMGLILFLTVSIIQEKHGSVGAVLDKKPFVVRFALYFLVLGLLIYTGNFDTVISAGFEYAQF